MKDKKYCIAMNLGGISNRVKCLVSMWRLADLYDRYLILEWRENHTCGCKFRDLFENEIEEKNEEELKKINKKNVQVFGQDVLSIENSPKKYLITGTWRFLLTPEELKNNLFLKEKRDFNEKGVDFNFRDVPENVKEEILKYLKKLRVLKSLQKEIDNFSKKNKLKEMIGLHIRRGDFADRLTSPGKVSSDREFLKRMKGLIEKDSKVKFFLCTDSKEMEEKIEKEFPGKIIKFLKSSFVRTDIRATQEGLIDLILLSKTKHILGTYRSTFTELAWWLGECKAEIEMVVDKEVEKEYFENWKKEKRKIIPKIKRFILKLIGRKYL